MACGGGDDGPSLEEYIRRMDELDKEVDALRQDVACAEDSTAAQCADAYGGLLSSAETLYANVTPAEEAQAEHDELVAAFRELGDNIAAEDFQADDPLDAFIEVFDTARVDAAFCAIQDIADENNIEADVGCNAVEAGPDPATLPPEETTDVLMEGFAFNPPHIQINVGDTVTWTQGADPEPHNAVAEDESFSFDPILDDGGTGEATFDEAGVYPYFCEVHTTMRGKVTVVE
jgi:plastocyanin